MSHELLIFTDGSSRGNPGPGGYGAVVVFPYDASGGEVVELGGNKADTTNNELELTAVIAALSLTSDSGAEKHVYTDSSYVVKGAMEWLHGWKKNDWRTSSDADVAHKHLWQQLDELIAEQDVSFHHVPGHAGIPGNERADTIALSFASSENPELYRGALSSYEHNVLSFDRERYATGIARSGKKQACWYISMIEGVVEKHTTWAECKARVEGASGAQYKKICSEGEEHDTLRAWGVM